MTLELTRVRLLVKRKAFSFLKWLRTDLNLKDGAQFYLLPFALSFTCDLKVRWTRETNSRVVYKTVKSFYIIYIYIYIYIVLVW